MGIRSAKILYEQANKDVTDRISISSCSPCVAVCAKAFQRSYWKLFKLAKIQKPDGTPKMCHPHMFRDTFAVELLLAGVPLEQVSLLLGDSSVKITERHYRPFAKRARNSLPPLSNWRGRNRLICSTKERVSAKASHICNVSYVSRKFHSDPITHRSAENLPFNMPHSKSS
jgi:hypothetical protein